MATRPVPLVPLSDEGDVGDPRVDAALQRPWRKARALSSLGSSLGHAAETFLDRAAFDRAPWLVVAFALGIGAWFVLPGPVSWFAWISGALFASIAAGAFVREDEFAHVRRAIIALGLLTAFGTALVWARSEMIGAAPIDRPQVVWIEGRVLERENQPSERRVRLTLAYRDATEGSARKVRVNVDPESVGGAVDEGARVRLRARLMPPGAPMVPGAYDFARTAWFAGLSATGSAIGAVEIVEAAPEGGTLARAQRALSDHVRSRVEGSAGAIAAAFASGDRGSIGEADEEAMRDSGLTHLLSISGVHVSALIAATYLLAMRLLALWPWLVLRVRLPLVAAAIAAGAGVGYTLLTGAEVPTIRSCVGALLVLVALALGREPLSMRMVATAAFVVLLLWPEALVGPSFQMSFVAVIAIVSLHEAAPVKRFLAPREEGWMARWGRRFAMLLLTGVVIELVLTPIVLFHFHRAGLYGALANVVAIPLVTFVSMPFIALGLALDTIGAGAPAWWVAGKSLDRLLGIAHFAAGQPGAVKLLPQMDRSTFALFVAGGVWLALWRGRARLLGLIPASIATLLMATTQAPDVLISGDGRHVGLAAADGRLLMLRETRSEFALENMRELTGLEGEPLSLDDWPGANCSADFCSLVLDRDGRSWTLLLARNRSRIEVRALAAACERADIVIADRYLPTACRPRWLKADRRYLDRNGGLALVLDDHRIAAVAVGQGDHPWWTARQQGALPRQ